MGGGLGDEGAGLVSTTAAAKNRSELAKTTTVEELLQLSLNFQVTEPHKRRGRGGVAAVAAAAANCQRSR